MRIAKSILSIVLILAGTRVALAGNVQTAASQASTPDALVKDLYKKHAANHGPFSQRKSRALLDHYFARELADMIWKDAVSSKGEVGALDGDPLYDAQDMEIKNFSIHPAKVDGKTAEVVVTFINIGEKKEFTFELIRIGAAWKITDIKYGEGRSLVGYFKDSGN